MNFLYLIQVKAIKAIKQVFSGNRADNSQSRLVKQWLLIPSLLLITTLACLTNTPSAGVAPPQPTRTPLPTFTPTPVPPSPTPVPTHTNTPIPTDTPPATPTPLVPDTPTPTPTDTPVPPTDTPAVPPTNTPIPPVSTPVPTPASPLATPTPPATALPDTPAGRYEEDGMDEERNCDFVAVVGHIRQRNGSAPVPYVTVQITGDENPFKGPYTAKTNENGDYTIIILEFHKATPEQVDKIDGVEFEAEIIGGSNVKSEDTREWEVSNDCDEDNAIQIMELDWKRREPKD